MAEPLFLFQGDQSGRGLMGVSFDHLKPWAEAPTAFFVHDSMNIILIGYRCSGKTQVGRILARRLGMGFCDTDARVERLAGKSIEGIVAEEGWDRFRLEEHQVVSTLAARDHQVIATGGGVILNEDNTRRLKENGWVVWLKAGPETLERRMAGDEKAHIARPSLTGWNPRKEIQEVLEERQPVYEQAADLVIDTTRISLDETALTIMQALEKRRQQEIHGGK